MDTITAQHVADTLNEAYMCDPSAIRALLCFSLPVNRALADHHSIQVRARTHRDMKSVDGLLEPDENGSLRLGFQMGVLGLINGFLAATGTVVCSRWSDEAEEDGSHTFLGFGTVEYASVQPQG